MGEATEEGDIPKRATTLSLAGVDLDRTGSVPLYRQIYDELLTRHLRRMRGLYAERQAALVEAAKRDLAGRFDVRRTETGIHLVGWLPEGTDDRLIAQRAAAAGIIARPVSSFRTGTIGRPGLVLGFAAVRPPEIRDAMQRLAAAFPPRAGAYST